MKATASDTNRFINALRDVLGLGPLPYSVDGRLRDDHLVPHMLRGMGDGCRQVRAREAPERAALSTLGGFHARSLFVRTERRSFREESCGSDGWSATQQRWR